MDAAFNANAADTIVIHYFDAKQLIRYSIDLIIVFNEISTLFTAEDIFAQRPWSST